MSNNGDEHNPNKTVFRPSPLQGLRNTAPSPPQPPAGGAPADPPRPQPPPAPNYPAAGQQTIVPGYPPPGQPAPPPYTPATAPQPAFASPPSQPGAGAMPQRAVIGDEDIPRPALEPSARNTMMTAAAPVLALIAGVRSGRVQISLPELHQKASAAVATFDQALAAASYDAEARQRARYAVLATIDDIAQNLPGQQADGAEWARRSLVVQAFNENIGGERFWRLLEEMLQRPSQYADLIELYHACLAVGFEGRFRVTPDGRARLQEIMTSAYAALSHPRAQSQTEVSPRWRGAPTQVGKLSFWATLALAASIAGGILLVLFIIMRLILMQTGQASIQALRAINPDQPLRMSRVAPAPPPPSSTQLQRIQGFLAPEIAQKLVVVEQDAQSIRIRTTVGQLFRSGSDGLESGRKALFERIAGAVESERGAVRVEGHADSDRVSSLAFPDNFALSKARAATVAQIIRGKLTDPKRVTDEGFGDGQPIASNADAAGKALNRRVEVVIPRGE